MLTKTFGRILTALSLALLPACTKAPEEKAGERLVITVRAENPATKTVLSDDGAVTSLAFTSGDQLGFFANGILSNIQLDYDEKADMFIGQAWVDSEQAEYREAVDYYAYYPFSIDAGKDLTALNGILPAKQVAPFDPRADFLVADPVTDDYFVDNFPHLSFEFDTHLFAIVRLSVTNSNPDYAGEEILSIGLKTTAPVTACLLTGVEPVLNPIWVALFYNEPITFLFALGGIIVLVSVTVYQLWDMKHQEASGAAG